MIYLNFSWDSPDNGTVLYTNNLTSWQAVPSSAFVAPLTVNVYAIAYIPYTAMTPTGVGYVVGGDDGVVQYATGTGVTANSWHPALSNLPTGAAIRSIYCVDPTSYSYQCLMAGDMSSLYTWSNGQTWQAQSLGFTDAFHDFRSVVKMNNSLVAVGFNYLPNTGNGFIATTTAAGSAWTTLSNSTYPELTTLLAK